MTSGQREVPVKRRGTPGLTLATIVLVLVAPSSTRAQDGGLSDAPRATRLPNGDVLFNKPAFEAVDAELKRLQGLERQHQSESWLIPVLVGLAVGTLVGVPLGVVVGRATSKSP